jgi:hypothetical protein
MPDGEQVLPVASAARCGWRGSSAVRSRLFPALGAAIERHGVSAFRSPSSLPIRDQRAPGAVAAATMTGRRFEDEARADAGAFMATRRAGLIALVRNPTTTMKTIAERIRLMVITRVMLVSVEFPMVGSLSFSRRAKSDVGSL